MPKSLPSGNLCNCCDHARFVLLGLRVAVGRCLFASMRIITVSEASLYIFDQPTDWKPQLNTAWLTSRCHCGTHWTAWSLESTRAPANSARLWRPPASSLQAWPSHCSSHPPLRRSSPSPGPQPCAGSAIFCLWSSTCCCMHVTGAASSNSHA